MKKTILFIGIYLMVATILVYQVTNPIQSEIIFTKASKATQAIDLRDELIDPKAISEFKKDMMPQYPLINKDL